MRLYLLVSSILFAACLLTACGKDSGDERDVAKAGTGQAQNAYDVYLQNREKSGELPGREERLQQHRDEKTRLAEAILAEGLVDEGQIEREVAAYRANLVVSRYFNDTLKEQVSDSAIRAYYDAHPEEFRRGRARFAQVRIPFGAESLPTQEQAFEQAMSVFRQLESESFDDMAFRERNMAAKVFMPAEGAYLELNGIDGSVRDAVLALEPGKTSDPLLVGNEYIVVKLLEPVAENTASFEQAAESIRFKLNNEIRIREKDRLLGAR